MPILLLHKPHHSSKSREHVTCLEKCLTRWQNGDIDDLLQKAFNSNSPSHIQHQKMGSYVTACAFSKLMFQGKTKAALRLITEQCKSGILHLNSTVHPFRIRSPDSAWGSPTTSTHPSGFHLQQQHRSPCNPSSPVWIHQCGTDKEGSPENRRCSWTIRLCKRWTRSFKLMMPKQYHR